MHVYPCANSRRALGIYKVRPSESPATLVDILYPSVSLLYKMPSSRVDGGELYDSVQPRSGRRCEPRCGGPENQPNPLYALCKGTFRPHDSLISNQLFLDSVESLEHAIDVLQVISAARNGGYVTLGLEVFLQVGLVAQVTELNSGISPNPNESET